MVAIARGVQLCLHRDSHNLLNSKNTVLALTEFKGGGIWLEDSTGEQWREVRPGKWIQGRVHDLRPGCPLSFCPRSWHETQKCAEDRVVIMTYTPRTKKLSLENKHRLRELGFELPQDDLDEEARQAQVPDTPCFEATTCSGSR